MYQALELETKLASPPFPGTPQVPARVQGWGGNRGERGTKGVANALGLGLEGSCGQAAC